MASERDKDGWVVRYDRGNEPTGCELSLRRPRASAVIEGRAVLNGPRVGSWAAASPAACIVRGLSRARACEPSTPLHAVWHRSIGVMGERRGQRDGPVA